MACVCRRFRESFAWWRSVSLLLKVALEVPISEFHLIIRRQLKVWLSCLDSSVFVLVSSPLARCIGARELVFVINPSLALWFLPRNCCGIIILKKIYFLMKPWWSRNVSQLKILLLVFVFLQVTLTNCLDHSLFLSHWHLDSAANGHSYTNCVCIWSDNTLKFPICCFI